MKVLSIDYSFDVFIQAAEILNDAVEHTLGPYGTNTAVLNNNGSYSIINDGKSIIEGLTSESPILAPAMETIKQASYETNRKAGDGTTSTIVLINALIENLSDYIKRGSCVQISNFIKELRDLLIEQLHKIAVKVQPEQYEDVARVSLGSDKYAKLIADTFRFTENKATPIFIKADQPDITSENINGVQLTKIKWATRMILDTLGKSEFGAMKSLVLFQPVNRFEEITQLVRKSFNYQEYVLLFYNDMSASILENLLLNLSNGTCKIIPVSLSEYGKFKSDLMSELADYMQTEVIDGANLKVSDVNKIEFGNISNAVLTQEQIVINNNACNDKKYVTFTTKSSIIKCGGNTQIDMEDNYKRIEDAVHSLQSAIDYGVVTGAGHTYANLMNDIILNMEIEQDNEFMHGLLLAMSKIKNDIGLKDVPSDIIDSALVIEEVIKNAFTMVSQIFTTQRFIHNNIR